MIGVDVSPLIRWCAVAVFVALAIGAVSEALFLAKLGG